MIAEIITFYNKCKRVCFSMRKPTKDEFLLSSKVSFIGVAVIGFMGFLISIFLSLFF